MGGEIATWFRRPWCWVAAAALALGNPLLHLPISDLCELYLKRHGFESYNRAALAFFGGVSLLVAAWLFVRLGRRGLNGRRAGALGGMFLISLGAHRWLTVLNTELVHFPQFALLAGLLLAGGAPAFAAWVIATVAGVADETYQQYVIYAGRTDTYLDFNDMLLNAIGAGWAVGLLAAPTAACGPSRRFWAGLGILLAASVAVQPPFTGDFWHYPLHGGRYHRMSAAEALVGATALWLLVRRGIASTSPREGYRPGHESRAGFP